MNIKIKAHFGAFITITIWSLTFVQTKILLNYLSPAEILIDRFLLAWMFFYVIAPKKIKTSLKDEFIFALLGFSGIFLYYILENLALENSYATNVGLIVTSTPVWTALISKIFFHEKKQKIYLLITSFLLVISGILILQNNSYSFKNGDFLALLAAVSFAFYSVLLSKTDKKYDNITITKKSFFYGIFFLTIYFIFTDGNFHINSYTYLKVWGNLLFLSVFASGICFLLWKHSVNIIGSVKTSTYIYLVPIINTVASHIILNEPVSLKLIVSTFLILAGLFISQKS